MTARTLRRVLHLADIHIGSSPSRSEEYRKVFQRLHALATNVDSVVIAGDIFHHKTHYAGQDVEDFKYLVNGIKCPILIIPGNHDVNLKSDQLDLITPIAQITPNITYQRDSGWFTHAGIRYYHISVFDTRDAAAIERFVEMNRDDCARSIMLYHGPVNGIRFGTHVVGSSNITANTMRSFAGVMLGDIHEHQNFGNAVYPGSLIQQNMGESTKKGIIMWDLTVEDGNVIEAEYRFEQIPNEVGFVRLDLRGKTKEQVVAEIAAAPKHIRVSVISDSNTNDLVEHVKGVYGGIDRHVNVDTTVVYVRDDIREELKVVLLRRGANQEVADELSNLFAERMTETNGARWTVTDLRWENMLGYRGKSRIDFTRVGVAAIIAANRAGKSAIIDILVFGLFGETLRGDKNSMFHHGTNVMSVRVDFTVGTHKFRIERRDNKGTAHVSIQLLEFLPDGNTRNHTGSTVTETHNKIKQLIGTREQFMSTGLYYNAESDLVQMGRTTRMNRLPALLGLEDVPVIQQEVRELIKTLRVREAALVKPRVTDVKTKLTDAINVLNCYCERIKGLREKQQMLIEEHKMLGTEIGSLRRPDVIMSEIKSISAQIEALRVAIPEAEPAPPASATAHQRAVVQRDKAPRKPDDIAEELYRVAAQIPEDALKPVDVAKMNMLTAIKQPMAPEKPAFTPDEIKQLEQQIKQLETEIAEAQKILTSADVSMPAAPVEPVEPTLREVPEPEDSLSKLQFSNSCGQCMHNHSHLRAQIALAKAEHDNAVAAAREQYDRQMATYQAAVQKYRVDVENYNTAMERYNAHKARIATAKGVLAKQPQLITLRKKHVAIVEAINKHTIMVERYNAETVKYQHAQETLAQLRADAELREKHLDAINSRATLQKELNDSREYYAALAACEAATKYDAWVARNEALAKHTEADKLQNKLRELNSELEASTAIDAKRARLEELKVIINNMYGEIDAVNMEWGKAEAEVDILRRELDIETTYNELAPPLKAEIEKQEMYLAAIGSPLLRKNIIMRNIGRILNTANNFLSMVADFRIESVVGETTVDLSLVDHTGTIPIGMGSGYQKFISSIALRFALVHTLLKVPTFMIIDEGFGTMDSSNLSKLPNLFSMCNMFSSMLVISHVSEMHGMFENKITIERIADPAREVNGKQYLYSRVYIGDVEEPTVEQRYAQVAALLDDAAEQPAEAQPVAAQPVTRQMDVYECPCGAVISRAGKVKHEKSQKHQAYIKGQQN